MVIAVTNFKGGCGKSTTAVHLAAYFCSRAPTVLIDGDPNRSVTTWSRRGALPFRVVDVLGLAKAAKDHEHIILDTAARPDADELKSLAEGCDLIVLPTLANLLDLSALMGIVESLEQIKLDKSKFKVLLTIVPPKPSRDGEEARAAIVEAGLPIFNRSIRRAAAFARAAVHGCCVCEVKDPKAAECWSDYKSVGQEILP